jgi:hypothetical protein
MSIQYTPDLQYSTIIYAYSRYRTATTHLLPLLPLMPHTHWNIFFFVDVPLFPTLNNPTAILLKRDRSTKFWQRYIPLRKTTVPLSGWLFSGQWLRWSRWYHHNGRDQYPWILFANIFPVLAYILHFLQSLSV